MTLNPPPEIVTFHLDKLSTPTGSTELLFVVLECVAPTSKTCKTRQSCNVTEASGPLFQPARALPSLKPPLPLDNNRPSHLANVLSPACLAVHLSFNNFPVTCWARRQHYPIPSLKLFSRAPESCLVIHPALWILGPTDRVSWPAFSHSTSALLPTRTLVSCLPFGPASRIHPRNHDRRRPRNLPAVVNNPICRPLLTDCSQLAATL